MTLSATSSAIHCVKQWSISAKILTVSALASDSAVAEDCQSDLSLAAPRDDDDVPVPISVYIADNVLAGWGTTKEWDGRNGDQPRDTLVQDNVIHELGFFEKQSSAWFQALTAVLLFG